METATQRWDHRPESPQSRLLLLLLHTPPPTPPPAPVERSRACPHAAEVTGPSAPMTPLWLCCRALPGPHGAGAWHGLVHPSACPAEPPGPLPVCQLGAESWAQTEQLEQLPGAAGRGGPSWGPQCQQLPARGRTVLPSGVASSLNAAARDRWVWRGPAQGEVASTPSCRASKAVLAFSGRAPPLPPTPTGSAARGSRPADRLTGACQALHPAVSLHGAWGWPGQTDRTRDPVPTSARVWLLSILGA